MNIIETHYAEDIMTETNSDEAEEIADAWLDTAIECKQAGRLRDCLEAHLQRMRACPYYKTTDAIRLLGLGNNGDEANIDEVSSEGVFEVGKRADSRFVPSKRAQKLGENVRRIFEKRGYKFYACQSFLLHYIKDGDDISNERRIFSAQSFVQHRHEVFESRQERQSDSTQDDITFLGELEILVWLFLFGLAISRKEAVEVLGQVDVDTLLEATLLRRSPADPETMLVAEVQVYPIDMGVFIHDYDDKDFSGLFLTDWTLECLRPTHSAVMSVGYDTLELMAVTAGEMTRQRKRIPQKILTSRETSSSKRKRILDLCCGCGIQGIFAWLCHNNCVAPLTEYETCELVLADINKRALHFATANLAINGVPDHCSFSLCGDLFGSLALDPFDLILCNPPFVAIPSQPDAILHEKTPLYGVGGGLDGMVCLQRILQSLYQFLSSQNTEAMAIMVTEVPNVEDSPTMLSSFIPESTRKEARIRIAYVGDDVETMEDYAREREVEAGIDDDHKEWLSSVLKAGIYNRALVLISFARSLQGEKSEENFCLFNFKGLQLKNDCTPLGNDSDNEVDPVDEEDLFLHPRGMAFAREALLTPHEGIL